MVFESQVTRAGKSGWAFCFKENDVVPIEGMVFESQGHKSRKARLGFCFKENDVVPIEGMVFESQEHRVSRKPSRAFLFNIESLSTQGWATQLPSGALRSGTQSTEKALAGFFV
jgi:hypothetical protein